MAFRCRVAQQQHQQGCPRAMVLSPPAAWRPEATINASTHPPAHPPTHQRSPPLLQRVLPVDVPEPGNCIAVRMEPVAGSRMAKMEPNDVPAARLTVCLWSGLWLLSDRMPPLNSSKI